MTRFDVQDIVTWNVLMCDKAVLPKDLGDYLVVIANVRTKTLSFKHVVAYYDGTHFLDYRFPDKEDAILTNVVAWTVLPGDSIIARCSLDAHDNIIFDTL